MKRILLHISFWTFYLLVTGYIEVAMVNYSFFDLPIGERLYKGFAPELIILVPKIAVTYFIMYYSIPRYLDTRRLGRMILEIFLALVLAVGLYRVLVQALIFPYIYEEIYQQQAWSKLLPRHIWTALDFFSVVGIAGSLKFLRLRLAGVEREKQLTEEKLQSELNYLRAQTNPHFLFNTLNNIYALARKKSDQTAEVVIRLSKILRFMLYECSAPSIPIQRELKVIQDYIELEKLRYNQRITIELKTELDDENQAIAPLLLLPFVENAFKHGLSESRFSAGVAIFLQLKQGNLHFRVKNSIEDRPKPEEQGIGLSNVKRQLALLYPDAHSLRIIAQPDSFEVELMISLNP
ncbi:MAG: hypothetical protein DHS20C18_02460 [Saprospiraceae bacterium]|nr:MAG: hypothetical protein DHS20C18_02460 [Saprospiraceae bacterium]